ncbi:MAG: cytochrome c3 family protein [Vicinamibacterales bacterium]
MRTLLRCVVLVLGGLLVMAGTAHAQLGALMSPGPLARAHRTLEGAANCSKCHEQGRRVTAQRCLSCHQPIAQRMARKFGVHKDVTDSCEACHAEHAGVDGELRPFDQAAFDHAAVAGFPLSGKHQLGAAKCAACHKGRSFVDATASCVSCHADVHRPSLGSNCATCHSTAAAFTAAATQFDHAKAAFPLTGAHATVACARCHTGKVFKGVKFASCANCHQDPHTPSLGAVCTSCHATDAWRTTKVDHARTAFPLAGAHARVTCQACHRQPAAKVALKFDTCTACHADVHRGGFSQDCRACHTEASWKGGRFDHATTRFPLEAKHAGLVCDQCHKAAAVPPTQVLALRRAPSAAGAASGTPARAVDFRGLTVACVSCHADVHGAELGTSCETCHSAEGFALRRYTHKRDGTFFGGRHLAVTCESCHQGLVPVRPSRTGTVALDVRFTAATRTCVSCHKDVHLAQFTAGCDTCHTIEREKFAVTIDHQAQTRFPLHGAHATVVCAGCHKTETGRFPAGAGTAVRFTGVGTTCVACHADVHLGQVGSGCEGCHSATSFRVATYTHRTKAATILMTGAHARASCADCHKAASGRFPAGQGLAVRYVTGTACTSCHVDQHRGALGPNCGTCHRP